MLVCHCTARQCSPLRRNFKECSINDPALSLLMKHLVIGQRQKPPKFSPLHWSPHSSLVSIGQHFVTTMVLNEKTETSLITESDRSGPNHESNQAVWAVHGCNSWLLPSIQVAHPAEK